MTNEQLSIKSSDPSVRNGFSQLLSGALTGYSALPVEVEVKVKSGTAKFTIIGLVDGAVREAKDRVESAIKQSGFKLPDQILVNLAPAEVRKEGSSFDLSIALGILIASGQLKPKTLRPISIFGELSLDGRVKPVRGLVAQTIQAFKGGVAEVIVPRENLSESSLISEVASIGVGSLAEAATYLSGGYVPEGSIIPKATRGNFNEKRLSEVKGQLSAKRALIVAAAGGHNLLFIGVPGAGKSMLAQRLPSILPALTREEVLEVVRIHSVAGYPIDQYLEGSRPFRSPHHGISEAGLIGGGGDPRPGEISLAHRGVLFLDEFPEFRRGAIESIRSPIESGKVRITRAKASVEYPASFQLVAAMNPCPCGRLGVSGTSCLCSPKVIQTYLKKLSQPILDRIDLQIELQPVAVGELTGAQSKKSDTSDSQIRSQVLDARGLALERLGKANALLSNQEIGDTLQSTKEAKVLIEKLAGRQDLSARGYFRMLKVARTIADLESSAEVKSGHVAEAAGYRSLDATQKYWG